MTTTGTDPEHHPSTAKFWWQTILFAVVIFVCGIGYNILYRGFVGASFSEALALTAGVLIGLSFALSGLTYYFDFLDTKLKYRKYLGLVGFYIAVIYTITLVVRFPERYWQNMASTAFTFEAVTGILAMAIFTFMAVISGNWAIKRLGKNWRPLLRVGYLAYFLLILRAFAIEGTIWANWLQELNSVPPPRLLLTIFAIGVILLRVALAISLKFKPRKTEVIAPPTPIMTAELPPTQQLQQTTQTQL